MKYICLGYIQPGKFENMSENERNAMLDECLDDDDKRNFLQPFLKESALRLLLG